jgi:hypothetical protein
VNDLLLEHCYDAGWTDGLPVVPPTPERVEAMLGGMVARSDEVVTTLDPGGGEATYEKIAANAVLAGCLPTFFPVVVAAVRAIAQPEFDLGDVLTTVHSQSPLLLVSGPVAQEVGMNGGASALGAGNRANATIGRALLLCCRNIAGARPGALDATTLAHPGNYSYCYTENFDSPWPALSVDRGFRADESAVTVYAADAPLCIAEMGRPSPEGVLLTIAKAAAIPGTYNSYQREELWLVLSPDHANIIAGAGWSKADIARFVYEHARVPGDLLRTTGLYGYAELRPPAWLDDVEAGDMIAVVDSPRRVVVTVAGGPFGGYTAVIFGSGVSVTGAL